MQAHAMTYDSTDSTLQDWKVRRQYETINAVILHMRDNLGTIVVSVDKQEWDSSQCICCYLIDVHQADTWLGAWQNSNTDTLVV